MILWLMACQMSPYPDYWPDKSQYPTIKGLDPVEVPSRVGGETVTMTGSRFDETRTVVVGGRNAEIVNVDTHSVQFIMPALPAGPEKVAVSIVTEHGAVTREDAMRVRSSVSEFTRDETVSVSLMRYDCPVEAWGVYADGTEASFGWCGVDMGYASAEAWWGSGPQPGFAVELAEITPLAELPPAGQVRLFKPEDKPHPDISLAYKPHGWLESIAVQTERNFAADLAFVEERRQLLDETYGVSQWIPPFVSLYDDDECWVDDLQIVSGDGDTLLVDGDASGATGATIGFGYIEEYEDGPYEDWATTGTAWVTGSDGAIVGNPSGVELWYDDYSGWFVASGVAVGVAAGDFPSGQYRVSTTDSRGMEKEQGYVEGPTPFDLWETWPDLTVGYGEIPLSEDLEVSWIPAPQDEFPTVVVVELVVYDMDIPHPNGSVEVGRLVTQGLDSSGSLTIPASALNQLPRTQNMWDDRDAMSGYWGDMTIARHQVRKVGMTHGDMVVDFVHAINGPITLTD